MSLITCRTAKGGIEVMVLRNRFENPENMSTKNPLGSAMSLNASTSQREGSSKNTGSPLT